jgi:NTP pyrophosphatase (non-canonical NTP hydrolase)
MSDIKDLQKKVIKFRDARDWKQFHNPKDVSLSLVLEATELMELFQWKNDKEVEEYVKKHRSEISDELADVLIWALLIGNDLSIDLKKAIESKLKKNKKKYPVKKSKGKYSKYTEYE